MNRKEIIQAAEEQFKEEVELILSKYLVRENVPYSELPSHVEIKGEYDSSELVEVVSYKLPEGNETETLSVFKDYCGRFILAYERLEFVRKYGGWKQSIVTEELSRLEIWITKAKKVSISESFDNPDFRNKYQEYQRLLNGFYLENKMEEEQLHQTSTASQVYGRYFLFKELLEKGGEESYPVEKYLGFMRGVNYLNTKQIMKLSDYDRMVTLTTNFLKDIISNKTPNATPFGIPNAIPMINLPKEVVRKAYHNIYTFILEKEHKDSLLRFMGDLFVDFKGLKGRKNLRGATDHSNFSKGHDQQTAFETKSF